MRCCVRSLSRATVTYGCLRYTCTTLYRTLPALNQHGSPPPGPLLPPPPPHPPPPPPQQQRRWLLQNTKVSMMPRSSAHSKPPIKSCPQGSGPGLSAFFPSTDQIFTHSCSPNSPPPPSPHYSAILFNLNQRPSVSLSHGAKWTTSVGSRLGRKASRCTRRRQFECSGSGWEHSSVSRLPLDLIDL